MLLDKLINKDEKTWDTVLKKATPMVSNPLTIPSGPASGKLSKELVNQIIIRGKLRGKEINEMFISQPSLDDIKTWEENQVDEVTKRNIEVQGNVKKLSITFHLLPDFIEDKDLVFAFEVHDTSDDTALDSLILAKVKT